MDADTLRAILDAQVMQQQVQHQKTLDAVMERMERLFSAMGATPAAAPASTAEFVTGSYSHINKGINSSSCQLPLRGRCKFCYSLRGFSFHAN